MNEANIIISKEEDIGVTDLVEHWLAISEESARALENNVSESGRSPVELPGGIRRPREEVEHSLPDKLEDDDGQTIQLVLPRNQKVEIRDLEGLKEVMQALLKKGNDINQVSILLRRWNHMRMELRWLRVEPRERDGSEGAEITW